MLVQLIYCFLAFFVGYIILRGLPLPFSYTQALTSFFTLLAMLAAMYLLLSQALKEQMQLAAEQRKLEKLKSLSWAVYPALHDFAKLLSTLDKQEGLFLYEKVQKAQNLLADNFTDTAKSWFLDDLLAYYEYVAERTGMPDFARVSEQLAQLEYLKGSKRLSILQGFSILVKLQKEYIFIRQTSAAGKMSSQYYKKYKILAVYDEEELKRSVRQVLLEIESYLQLKEEMLAGEPEVKKQLAQEQEEKQAGAT